MFVKKLFTYDGVEEQSKYSFGGTGTAIVSLGEGQEKLYDLWDLREEDCIGIFKDATPFGQLVAGVVHTVKTAKFHDCVESVRRIQEYGSGINGNDWVNIYTERDIYGSFVDGTQPRGSGCLVINTTKRNIDIMGYKGSVVLRSNLTGFTPAVYTLYDIISELCKVSGINLLLYRELRFKSSHNDTYVVKLKSDAESERFYAKMCVDIYRG